MPKSSFCRLIAVSFLLFVVIPTHTWAQESSDREAEICPAIDHSQWNELLKKYVDTKGNVAYKAFAEEEQKLTAYLNYLDSNAPSQDCSVNTRLSYYINLYNAATVKLIIDNYPLNSIKDIKNPWSKKRVLVGGKKYSLGYIEHKILRKMNEPRIHFAINCASYSCPKLIDQAFLSETMETQLEAATKDFVNDPSRNEISPEKIQLSAIFKWYKGDFIKNGRLIEYIDHYSRTKATEGTKISYLTYDWGLNEAR